MAKHWNPVSEFEEQDDDIEVRVAAADAARLRVFARAQNITLKRAIGHLLARNVSDEEYTEHAAAARSLIAETGGYTVTAADEQAAEAFAAPWPRGWFRQVGFALDWTAIAALTEGHPLLGGLMVQAALGKGALLVHDLAIYAAEAHHPGSLRFCTKAGALNRIGTGFEWGSGPDVPHLTDMEIMQPFYLCHANHDLTLLTVRPQIYEGLGITVAAPR
ncbi:hypothetical protein BIV57_10900 [Mangrovactinospora gilvigrisea]|uniref:Uncharacterized protein n=1 Tax=Mangrovactinospora gilvigrisea TaxID=1428644 RepID=A0A1J7C7F9_9ACTN|nr:hypothetical protein [Mangrovactinospora gilvigrisea]OIV37468.1 hypothetical protein BIV57_10900 [Mangrovactinospora gilvigrisea]